MQRILIVDDSPTIRKMVRASLADVGAAGFVEAGTGLEAIEQLALGGVELIVLDLNMPDMHGIDVLKFLRSHRTYRDMPVIVLTTRGDEASRAMADEAGATTYMTKPIRASRAVDCRAHAPQARRRSRGAGIDHACLPPMIVEAGLSDRAVPLPRMADAILEYL